MKFFGFLRNIKKSFSRYNPSIEILISKGNLLHNLNEYRNKYPNFLFAPVLKSNAYGHGLVEVAQILDKENIPFFVVDSLYEAMILRNNGIKSEILIIGYSKTENIENAKLQKISFTISSLEQLEKIAKTIKSAIKIHLKIDTGMHRQGILPEQIGEAIKIIKKSSFLKLEGVCSHFADADNNGDSFTKSQIEEWKKAVLLFKENFQNIKFFHISATAGTHYSELAHGNVVRLGIGLYGINPPPRLERDTSFKKGGINLRKLNFKPVLGMRSIITSVKTIPAGECVGYNCAYKTNKTTKVATVPVGYFEGVDRKLSNRGVFKVGGYDCPIIGMVSMNMCSIDVTLVLEAKTGDAVIIISNGKDDKNSVENIAELIKTIPYEILVHIPQHLRRVVH